MTYSLLQTVTYTLLARWEDQQFRTPAFFLYVDNLCNPVIKPHNDNLDDDHSQGGNNFDPLHHVDHHNRVDHPHHVDYHLHHPQGVPHPNQEVSQGAQNLSQLLMFDFLFHLGMFLSDITCYCSSWECSSHCCSASPLQPGWLTTPLLISGSSHHYHHHHH